MSLPCDDGSASLSPIDVRRVGRHRAVRPPRWALATLLAACGPSGGDGDGTADDAGTGSSSDTTDGTATGPGTTGPGTTSSDSSGPVDPTLADSSSGTDDTGTTGEETAADGCWDRKSVV